MNSTLTKSERRALEELFISIQEKKGFIKRISKSKKEMFKIFKILKKKSNS